MISSKSTYHTLVMQRPIELAADPDALRMRTFCQPPIILSSPRRFDAPLGAKRHRPRAFSYELTIVFHSSREQFPLTPAISPCYTSAQEASCNRTRIIDSGDYVEHAV